MKATFAILITILVAVFFGALAANSAPAMTVVLSSGILFILVTSADSRKSGIDLCLPEASEEWVYASSQESTTLPLPALSAPIPEVVIRGTVSLSTALSQQEGALYFAESWKRLYPVPMGLASLPIELSDREVVLSGNMIFDVDTASVLGFIRSQIDSVPTPPKYRFADILD